MFKDLVKKNRSYRRFYEDPIEVETLREFVDCARLTASGANKQPLKYVLSCDKQMNAAIFDNLMWAGYLSDWPGPVEGERPSAYILIVADKEIGPGNIDHGIAAQTILLAATEQELGGCILANVRRPDLMKLLELPEQYEILLVLALGKPKEAVVIDEIAPGESIKYWRDENAVHHVPKRALDDIIIAVKE